MDKKITFGDVLELLDNESDSRSVINVRMGEDRLSGPVSSKLWGPMRHLTVRGIDIGIGCLEVVVDGDQ